ncbi:MAG: LamG domain-containing protein, partial [Limisphaerales bacterium]
GQDPLTYQWSLNTTNIIGATSNILVVTDASPAKAGDYRVTITNPLGTTNSASATLTVLTLPEGSYAASVLNANPLIYYRFSEAGATNVAFNLGSLGPANNGLYEGSITAGAGPQTPTFPNFELTNNAAVFDAITTDVKIPAINFNTNLPVGVTLAAWINRNGPQAPNAGVIFYRGTGGANGIGVNIDVLQYHWNNANFGFNSGLVVPNSQWVLVALVIEPTQATLYLNDGVSLLSATNVAPHTAVAFSDNTSYIGWDPFSSARRFYGTIDEPMIFGRALTPTEISALYSAATTSAVRLQITKSGGNVVVTWPTGTLQQSSDVTGPYSDLTGVTSPYTSVPSADKMFYRVRIP